MSSGKLWTKTIEPHSYDQIYRYVDNDLSECSNLIDQLEKDYYQGTNGSFAIPSKHSSSKRPLAVNTLLAWSRPLNELRLAKSLNDFRNGKHVRDALADARIGALITSVSDESIYLMKRVLDKTTEQLYSKIPMLANRINDCMNTMEQYFLSFYQIENIQEILQNKKKEKDPDEYLETPYTYERSRCLHMFQVNKSLKLLREMQQRIEDTKGIVLSTLSKECQELAVRCDCTSLSFVFALPECYIEARRAVMALRAWLVEDSQYLMFIQSSVKMIEEKYHETSKHYDLAKVQLSHAEHRVNSFRLMLDKSEEENEMNQKKLDELEERMNNKEREYLSKRLTNEVYEDQLKKMLQEAEENPDGLDNHLSIERFQQEIRQFHKELPKLKSQIEAIQTRMEFFKGKKQELIEMRNECKKLEYESQLAFEEKILKENEFHRVTKAREILRMINKCRSANDLPVKIFYSLPIHPKNSVEHENDDLAKAMRLTAKHISRDWNRLYCQLPFYPTRGREEISKDITHIDDKYHRGDVFCEQAKESLNKWRRFHTRAKLDDLIKALQKIHRTDIVQLIDRRILKPKRSAEEIREEIDPRKKEIEELNRKLNGLFEKIRTGVIPTHDTYVYSTIGLDPLKPFIKEKISSKKRADALTTKPIGKVSYG